MSRVDFDVIVVGAGHAGCEAALSCARRGLKTLVITTNLNHIAYMSCNPAVGGVAKGHIVREIDALGGEMGYNTDLSTIQFKRLNTRKGPAVRASRSQCDKEVYARTMNATLSSTANLSLLQAEVKRLSVEGNKCSGVLIGDDEKGSLQEIRGLATIITTGTFMNGVMHVGFEKTSGGRAGDKASVGLSGHLKELGFRVTRLKTGTPARLHKDSIDWSKTTVQVGDEKFYPFSRRTAGLTLPQVPCYLSYTNSETHEIIRKNLDRSPLYCGLIEGIGPRYCPSIEDKVVRFADKDRHQTFLEPEGLSSDLIYVQGMSTSLPYDVQDKFLRTIPGLENCKIIRAGYAVEYDFIHPTQLQRTLETKDIEGLFLAGQVNGTSGYEEAAGQGLWAGLNAGNRILGQEPFFLGRDEAYLGVLIDDLVTKGTEEPYRMFTSRAEFRLLLREDNTDDRLLRKGFGLGLISDVEIRKLEGLQQDLGRVRGLLREKTLVPNRETLSRLATRKTSEIVKPTTLEEILRRPEIQYDDVVALDGELKTTDQIREKIEIEVKYSGYIERQRDLVDQSKRLEGLKIPRDFDFTKVVGFSAEEREKLLKIRPETIGQAHRISGVNPSAIQALLIHLKGREKLRNVIAQ